MTRKLSITLLALLVVSATGLINEAKAITPHEVKEVIVKTAISMGVDPCVALSIAKHESEFQAQKKSPSGAVGVFQLMPSTARRIGVNPYLLNENVKGGIMYYQMMYKKFGSMDLALAAYNAGPGNVAKYNGVPPFRETKRFINGIKSNYKTFEQDPAVLKHTTLKQDDKTGNANEVNGSKNEVNEPAKTLSSNKIENSKNHKLTKIMEHKNKETKIAEKKDSKSESEISNLSQDSVLKSVEDIQMNAPIPGNSASVIADSVDSEVNMKKQLKGFLNIRRKFFNDEDDAVVIQDTL